MARNSNGGLTMSDEARDAVGDYQFGFHDPENATIRFDKGLSEPVSYTHLTLPTT